MKKRILAMAFAVMMAFGAAACGGGAEGDTENAQAAEMQAQLDNRKGCDKRIKLH